MNLRTQEIMWSVCKWNKWS